MSEFPGSDGSNRRSEFRSGWPILLAATLGIMLGFPTLAVHTLGLFAPSLTSTFKWSFAQVMGGLTIVTVVVILSGPITGYLCDRYGGRKLIFLSSVALGLSFAAFAFSTASLLQYYATWLVMSIAASGSTQLVWTRALNEHFAERRGFALGIALSGVGFFAVCGKLLVGVLIRNCGWRAAFAVIGSLPILIVAPVCLWALSGNGNSAQRVTSITGMTFLQTLGRRQFWLLAVAFLPMSLAIGGPIPNLENILHSRGFSHSIVLGMTPWIGVAMIAGRLGGGWLADRIWVPLLACGFMAINAVASLVLSQSAVSFKMAMLSILMLGTATGAEIDLASYLVARYLGVKHYGLIYGVLYGMIAVGGGVGPMLFARVFDHTGGYSPALVATSSLLMIPAVALLLLGPYPKVSNIVEQPFPKSAHANAK